MTHTLTKLTSQKWFVPLALLVATGTLLGISTNLAKIAADIKLSPLAFLTWSVFGASLSLFAIGAARGRLPHFTARTIEYFLIAGFVSTAAPSLLFFAAIPRVGATFVALAIAFPPLFTYLGALSLRIERFDKQRAAGVVFALSGAAVLAFFKLSAPGAEVLWIVATFLGALLLATGNLYRTARWPKGSDPDELAPGLLGAAALLLLIFGLVTQILPGPLSEFSLAVPTDSLAPALLILAQTATYTLQFLLFFRLQQLGGPVYLSLLGSVGAIVSVPISVLVLGEAIPQGLAVSSFLIALGIGLLTFGKFKTADSAKK